jgi:hypothetical protein
VLVLDMIQILLPLGKYKYDTCRILPVKCYIDNSMHLWSCIETSIIIFGAVAGEEASIFYLSIDYMG